MRFVDYMQTWQMNLAIAIDYTGSNSDPDVPGSLHWNGGPLPN